MKKIFFSLTGLLLASCSNNPPPNPNPDVRLKFIDTYNMTKLENMQIYSMTIDTIGPYCFSNCDSLKIDNFCDLFDIRFLFQHNANENYLGWPFYQPITDKYGKRWSLSWGSGLDTAPYYNNCIYGDSIKIRFHLNNILYYFDDGVPYLDTMYTHVGVRN